MNKIFCVVLYVVIFTISSQMHGMQAIENSIHIVGQGLEKIDVGITRVMELKVIKLLATIGGLGCIAALAYKALRMGLLGYDLYDSNYVDRVDFDQLKNRVDDAHGRINSLQDLPTNKRELKNLFGR